ncbi:MAG: LysE family translocator [Phyllobacterium sp.]
MDAGWLGGLIGFAFAMAATPGPNNMMAAASGANHGIARSLPFMTGIAIGVAAIMLAVAAFGSSVVTDRRVGSALKWAGVIYLLWLAWKIARAEPAFDGSNGAKPERIAPLSLAQGALLQFVNPKLWVMVSGAVVTYGQVSGETGRATLALLFAFIFGMMTFISTIAWAALGASVGQRLTSRRAVRAFNGAMAALLVASLIPIVLE